MPKIGYATIFVSCLVTAMEELFGAAFFANLRPYLVSKNFGLVVL